MGMNRKGKGGMTIFLVVAVVAVIGMLAVLVLPQAKETFAPSPTEVTGVAVAPVTSLGKLASVKMKAIDADNRSKVASNGYCWNEASPNDLLEDTKSITTSEWATVSNVRVGQRICCVAFSDTAQYGDTLCKDIVGETEEFTLTTYAIASGIQVSMELDNTIVTGDAKGSKNMTLGASGEDSWDYIKIKQNTTNFYFNLDSIVVDLVANTNISDVNLEGGQFALSESSEKITRLGDTQNYRFKLNTPLMMKENQELSTGALSITADSDGCEDNGGEDVVIYYLDNQKFKSQKDGSIKSGVENDASSPASVGKADISYTFTCN